MCTLLTVRSCCTQSMMMTIIATARGHIAVGMMMTAADGGGGITGITAIAIMTMTVGQGTAIMTIADTATARNHC